MIGRTVVTPKANPTEKPHSFLFFAEYDAKVHYWRSRGIEAADHRFANLFRFRATTAVRRTIRFPNGPSRYLCAHRTRSLLPHLQFNDSRDSSSKSFFKWQGKTLHQKKSQPHVSK
jgi:hypothetical protein